jgi:hypothetical protein
LIRQHAEWLLRGMPIREGLRRWRAANGPCDPRSTTGKMSYGAYVRLFSNVRLTGRWEFGRKRNLWSSKRDYTRQVTQQDENVASFQDEDLRILPDEIFYALKQRMMARKIGPRGPRKRKELQLCDLVIDVFECQPCMRRLHSCGSHNQAMHCPEPDCPAHAIIDRDQAVAAVCAKLTEILGRDNSIAHAIEAAVQRLAAAGSKSDAQRVIELQRAIHRRSNRVNDLTELAGEGSDTDRADLKAKVRAALAERAKLQLELARAEQQTRARTDIKATMYVRSSLISAPYCMREPVVGWVRMRSSAPLIFFASWSAGASR